MARLSIVLCASQVERLAAVLVQVFATVPRTGTRVQVVCGGPYPDDCGALVAHVQAPDGVEVLDPVVAAQNASRDAMVSQGLDVVLADDAVSHVAWLFDDVGVFPGWVEQLRGALVAQQVELDDLSWRMDSWGRPGFAVPVMDQTAAIGQRVDLTKEQVALGADAYARARVDHLSGVVSPCSSPDPACVMADVQALRAVAGAMAVDDFDPILDASCGTWAWRDLWVRARGRGWVPVVAEGCYVQRARTVRLGAWEAGEGTDRAAYLSKHRANTTERKHIVVATVRVRLGVLQDLHLLRGVVAGVAGRCDGIALLIGNNPLDMESDPEFKEATASATPRLSPSDLQLLRACSDAEPEDIAREVGAWVISVTRSVVKQGFKVAVRPWAKDPDENAERRSLCDLATTMGATWMLAVEQDEVLEDGVTADHIRRMARHPDPAVRAYDVAFLTHWNSAGMVRDDEPFGDGGTNRGWAHGVRMFRADANPAATIDGRSTVAPLVTPDAVRVGAVRLRRFGFLRPNDRNRKRVQGTAESDVLRFCEMPANNRLGLHMLCYEREDSDDLGRWLDDTHGLCDHAVLVWTGTWHEQDKAWTVDAAKEVHRGDALRAMGIDAVWPASGPAHDLATIAQAYGAEWVHHELDNDLAGARNAGIQALAEHQPSLAWAWFMDPDEWLSHPMPDARAVRRMADSFRWGWLMQVANYHRDAAPTVSDSVRISRLDPDGVMRMDGRVHESFTQAMMALQAKGVHPRLVYAPFVVQHRGGAFDADRMREKLDLYEGMLRLELADNPHNAGAWVSLGWHYFNDGHEDQGVECYRRALACAGRSYLPYREMAYHHLRAARVLMDACMERLTPAHQFWKGAEELSEVLRRVAPAHPVVSRGTERPIAELPDWTPPEYDAGEGAT